MVNDYEGIWVSLARALANKETEIFYDFGPRASYKKVLIIHNRLIVYGYDVKFEGTGLRVMLSKKGNNYGK